MSRLARPAVWFAGGLGALLIAIVIVHGVLRVVHSGWVFFFPEGPVLMSIHTLAETGSLRALYPADQWTSGPPLVATIYAPLFIAASAGLAVLTGTTHNLLTARVLSLGALLGSLALIAAVGRRRHLDMRLLVFVAGTMLVGPGIENLVAAAQVDVMALLWTILGMAILHATGATADRPSARRLWVAGLCFILAFFTKQSFVAAPIAAVITELLCRRPRRALAFAGILSVTMLAGVALLNILTRGGYVANTVQALVVAPNLSGFVAILRDSQPLQWWVWLGVVFLLGARRLRWGLPEVYALSSWAVHLAAMLKTGASVNYLVEPMFATLLLTAMRLPAENEVLTSGRGRLRPVLLGSLVALLAASVPLAAALMADVVVLSTRDLGYGIEAYDDAPALVDVYYIPPLLARGSAPYLSDPLLFGLLHESGQWDVQGLIDDLEARRIPYLMTDTDLSLGPASPESRTKDLLHAYFWRVPEIWGAVTRHYEPVTESAPFIWTPRPGSGEVRR